MVTFIYIYTYVTDVIGDVTETGIGLDVTHLIAMELVSFSNPYNVQLKCIYKKKGI